MRPIIRGVLAAFFFAFTFIINRSMELEGGNWIWSASLRYFFMVPFLLLLVIGRKNLKPLMKEMKKNPKAWLLWSTVGFGLFYGPLMFFSRLCTWMANRFNMANHDYFRFLIGPPFF